MYMEPINEIVQMMDNDTMSHCIGTRNMAQMVEEEYGLKDDLLSKSASIHDVGKIYITKRILEKPESLSSIEKKIVDLHSYISYCVAKEYGVEEQICRVILYHHSDCPMALGEIPPCDKLTEEYAKYLYSIDAYQAMISKRPYRPGHSPKEALEIMENEKNHSPLIIEFIKKHYVF